MRDLRYSLQKGAVCNQECAHLGTRGRRRGFSPQSPRATRLQPQFGCVGKIRFSQQTLSFPIFFFGFSHCNNWSVGAGTEKRGKMAFSSCVAGAKRGHFAFCANFGTIFGQKKFRLSQLNLNFFKRIFQVNGLNPNLRSKNRYIRNGPCASWRTSLCV